MTTRPQARPTLLIVLAILAALLALPAVLDSRTLTARQATTSTEVATLKIAPNPRVKFAPLAGRRTPAPIANLEAPLAGRRTPAPIANLEAPLAGRRTPAPVANAEAPLNMQKLPGSALYVLGTAAIVLIGAVREHLKRR